MKTEIGAKNQSIPTEQNHFITDSVTSKDGTSIGFRQIGRGPGLVLVQGAMGTAQNFAQLAEALADSFTVYMPDRRGRGLSATSSAEYGVQKEMEDLKALLDKTGAHYIFGLSSGALITLQASLRLPAIRKAAVYEPPLFVQGAPTALMKQYEKEMAEGRLAAAMVTAMQATQMGPRIFQAMPRWLLELLTRMAMEGDDKQAESGEVTMRMLAPTLRSDFQVVTEMSGALESFRAVRAKVLLLGGSKSPAYLRRDLDALEKVLPHVARIEFPGLGHAAAWNYDKQGNPDGKPEQVARELLRFFADS